MDWSETYVKQSEADALIRELESKIEDLSSSVRVLESLRPLWAQGYSSDSMAAQSLGNALTQLWETIGVKDQTAAMFKLRELMKESE